MAAVTIVFYFLLYTLRKLGDSQVKFCFTGCVIRRVLLAQQ